MKKGYWVVAYRTVADEESMKRYGELARAALAESGGRVLVPPRGAVTAYEAALKLPVAMVEFDSYEAALAAYETEAYKKARAVLEKKAERDFRIVEGA